MRFEVTLEPAGAEADKILAGWRKTWQLGTAGNTEFIMPGEKCLDIIFDLRARCYDREIMVATIFTDAE